MKYSLRSLMIVVIVAPPLLAWAALPLYRWLTTPKAPETVLILTTPPMFVTDVMPPEVEHIPVVTLPNSQTQAP